MNVTFLIGNGFDLACGMKSSYADIYKAYVAAHQTVPLDRNLIDFPMFLKELPTWGDFEMELAKNAHRFSSAEALITCLFNFQEFMNSYLCNEESRCKQRIFSSAEYRRAICKEFQLSLLHFYKFSSENATDAVYNLLARSRHKDAHYQFITFNYTSIFSFILDDVSKLYPGTSGNGRLFSPPIHIHGTLNEDLTLGADNLAQYGALPFTLEPEDIACLVKPKFNELYDKSRVSSAEEAIQSSDVICVYGASLGDSDLTWRNQVLDWLKESTTRQLFFYDYDCSQCKSPVAAVRIRNEALAQKMLINKWNIAKDFPIDRFHIPFGANIFNFKEKCPQPIPYLH